MSEIKFTPDEIATYYAVRVPHLKQSPTKEWRGPCPIHHGKKDSFAVRSSTGCWFCHSDCGFGGDIIQLEVALTSEDPSTCKATVFQLVGKTETESTTSANPLSADLQPANSIATGDGSEEIEHYPYQDVDGSLLFWVVRHIEPTGQKCFRQCRPDGQGGVIWNLDGVERVPYRLPKLVQAETVYLPEGEKDVHTLEEWGLAASCNPGGAGNSKLYTGWGEYFKGRNVVILPDNDEPGRKHGAAVAAALFSVAASIRIVELPGLPEKGDVTDWRDTGRTLEEFSELTNAAAPLDLVALSGLLKSWGQAGQTAKQKAPTNVLATRRLSDIEAKPVDWLWRGRIARGKVTVIAGDPGTGKSQLAVYIAAIVTTGGFWPVDQQQCKTGSVVFLNGEDDPADTLRPRLEAAGANLKCVHFADGVTVHSVNGPNSKQFSLQADLQALDNKLDDLENVAVVIIDPITAYLGGVDSHKNADVRALLAPLGELAARHNTAIIGISHLTKAGGPQVLMRVTGSLAFVAAARAAFLVAKDQHDEGRRFFLPMKNNIGPDDQGLAFHIESATVQSPAGALTTSRVVWEPELVSVTADEVMQSEMAPQGASALEEATAWLKTALAAGPVGAAKICAEVKASGITGMTLRRAATALSVVRHKSSMQGGWLWSLPAKSLNKKEAAQGESVNTFGQVEHLPNSQHFADML